MSLADLLSVSPRELFETLLAVLFGTYLSQQVFHPSLPAAPRPTYPVLPPAPVSTPAILLLDPPPLASGFTSSLLSRNDPTSLLHVSPLAYTLDDTRVPVQNVEVLFYSVVALAFHLGILLTIIRCAFHRPPTRSERPFSVVAQLYESLTGRPYESTHWERVLSGPDTGLSWYINSPDVLFDVDASPSPPDSEATSETCVDEGSTYAAYFDAGRIDAFSAYLLTVGYTDLRIWAFDITPDNQPFTNTAVTIDFRFTARSATQELMTRSILRFVFPCDVPKDRKDFMLWDLGEGWIRAFEVGLVEAVMLPVDEREERMQREEENLARFAVLPFHLKEKQDIDTAELDFANSNKDSVLALVLASQHSKEFAQLPLLNPATVELLFNHPVSATANLFGRRASHRRGTTSVFALDASYTQALVPTTSKPWLLDAFDGARGRSAAPKLLAASTVAIQFEETTPRSDLDMTDGPALLINTEITEIDGSWSAHMSESQTEENALIAPDEDFVVVDGDLEEFSPASVAEPEPVGFTFEADVEAVIIPSAAEKEVVSSGAIQEEVLEERAVVAATEPGSQHEQAVKLVDEEESRLGGAVALITETAGLADVQVDVASERCADNMMDEGLHSGSENDNATVGPSSPAMDASQLAGAEASPLEGVSAEVPSFELEEPIREVSVAESLQGLPVPAVEVSAVDDFVPHLSEPVASVPEISTPLDAALDMLVDAPLNSAIDLPAPESLPESVVDVQQDLEVSEDVEPMLLKTPGEYLRMYAGQRPVESISSMNELDVEGAQSIMIGPVLPPTED